MPVTLGDEGALVPMGLGGDDWPKAMAQESAVAPKMESRDFVVIEGGGK